MFKRFEELKKRFERLGYVYSFKENDSTHEFTHKDNEELCFSAYDYINEDSTDWNKVCDELEKEGAFALRDEVTILDLRNGDVFVKFGEGYAHTYFKGNAGQIMEDINGFLEGADTECWDNNEIDNWAACYDSVTTDKLTLDELKAELNM